MLMISGYSSRLQTLTRDLERNRGHVSSNETSSAHKLLRQDNQFQKPASNLVAKIDKSSEKPKATASSNSDAVFPPLLRNTEMYFHSPYQPLLYGKQRRKQGLLLSLIRCFGPSFTVSTIKYIKLMMHRTTKLIFLQENKIKNIFQYGHHANTHVSARTRA